MGSYIVSFTEQAELDLKHWQTANPKIVAKIENLILDVLEHPGSGIGKPEPLRHQLSGCWSRRINHSDRMVYSVDEENKKIIIYQLRYHY